MRLLVNDTIVSFPSSLAEITLGQRIDFHEQYGRELDQRAGAIDGMEEGADKEAEGLALYFDRINAAVAFFCGCTPEVLADAPASPEVFAEIYTSCLQDILEAPWREFEARQDFLWNDEHWVLPAPKVDHGDPMTFGEIIDAKQVIKDKLQHGATLWDYLPEICTIYLRRYQEPYDESFLHAGSERLQRMRDLPLHIALQAAVFFEQLNDFLAESFPVFWPGRVKSAGKHSRAHFDRWGWVNFLKSIAAAKVFDVPGGRLNSIDCVRLAPAFDVLIYASEEKELGEAQYLDYEEQKPKS